MFTTTAFAKRSEAGGGGVLQRIHQLTLVAYELMEGRSWRHVHSTESQATLVLIREMAHFAFTGWKKNKMHPVSHTLHDDDTEQRQQVNVRSLKPVVGGEL